MPSQVRLPSEFYTPARYPLTELNDIVDLSICPEEDTRDFLLKNYITQRLGGVVLANTDYRTDTYNPSPLATEQEIKAAKISGSRLDTAALFDRAGFYPSGIVRVKRDTNGEPIRDCVNKAETYYFDSEGAYLAVFGLTRIVKDGESTKCIVPRAIRAFGYRADIRFGLELPVTSGLGLADMPIKAAFGQKEFSISYNEDAIEGREGDPVAVQIAVRAAARAITGYTLRLYYPERYRSLQRAEESNDTLPELIAA